LSEPAPAACAIANPQLAASNAAANVNVVAFNIAVSPLGTPEPRLGWQRRTTSPGSRRLTAAQQVGQFGRRAELLVAEGAAFDYPPGMRRILRCAFVTFLSLALSASGATLGLAQMAAHASAGEHNHHADAHAEQGHHAHHGAGQASADEDTQQAGDHPSKNCCSACTVVSPLPPVLQTIVDLIVSPTVYSNFARFDVGHAIPIDPGVPKRMG